MSRTHAVLTVEDERTLCGRTPDFWAAPNGLVILAEGDDIAAVDCLACGRSLAALGDSHQPEEPS